MSSAQFNYRNPLTDGSFTDNLSDLFLGTNKVNNKNTSALLNYQNQFNEYMANKQMAFQKDMSNTAYQRAIADMKAAGINPMVAAANGHLSPASSPSGSSASSVSVSPNKSRVAQSILGSATAKFASQITDKFMPNYREEKLDKGLDRLGKVAKIIPFIA